MTAVIYNQAVVDAQQVDALSDVEAMISGIDAFLRDPIGYGEYDFADPISVDEFSTCRHMHGMYVAVLS